MGVFADLAEAKTFETGRYFKPGVYEVIFKKIARERSEKNKAVSHYKVITEVVSCESIDGKEAPYKKGDEVNCIWDLTKASGPSNAKMFVRRASAQYATDAGASEADLKALDKDFNPNSPPEANGDHPSEKHFASCTGPDSVLVGMKMRVEAFNNAEGTFTNVNWIVRSKT